MRLNSRKNLLNISSWAFLLVFFRQSIYICVLFDWPSSGQALIAMCCSGPLWTSLMSFDIPTCFHPSLFSQINLVNFITTSLMGCSFDIFNRCICFGFCSIPKYVTGDGPASNSSGKAFTARLFVLVFYLQPCESNSTIESFVSNTYTDTVAREPTAPVRYGIIGALCVSELDPRSN